MHFASLQKREFYISNASEYLNCDIKYHYAEIVAASDIRGINLYEKCIYPTFNNTIISIIWE